MESDCSIDCSSPISDSISSKTDISLRSPAGIIRPHIAIIESRPNVLIETVLPPVLGPVITRVSKSLPSMISTGTTFFGSMSGCLAALRLIIPLSLSMGGIALII